MAEGRLGTPTGPSGEERLLVWEKGPDKSCWSRGENYLVKNTINKNHSTGENYEQTG